MWRGNMPRLYKDSWGNIYKKSAFGSYSDGFSSYAKVAASPGYGIPDFFDFLNNRGE